MTKSRGGRPKNPITTETAITMRAQGLSIEQIAEQAKVNPKTIRRRLAKDEPSVRVRASGRVDPAPAPEAPASEVDISDVPDEIPDGTPLKRLDRWLKKVNGAIEAAEAAKNYPLLGQLIARGTALQDARRKASPPPKVDPNANPDMLAAKERARKEFHRLIEGVTA